MARSFLCKQCSRLFKYGLASIVVQLTVLSLLATTSVANYAFSLYHSDIMGLVLGNGVQQRDETGAIDHNVIFVLDEYTRCVHDKCHTSSVSPFDDTTKIIKAIHAADRDRPLHLVISTNGGSLMHCQQIIRWLRLHPAGYTVYCNEAYSSGTLVSISADELVMSNHSLLGKIDPQYAGQEEIIFRAIYRDWLQAEGGTNRSDALRGHDYALKRSEATLNTLEKIIRESMPAYLTPQSVIDGPLLYSELRHFTTFNIEEVRQMGINVRTPLEHEASYFGYFQAK